MSILQDWKRALKPRLVIAHNITYYLLVISYNILIFF